MITIKPPQRSIPITNEGRPEPRFIGWSEQISRAVNQAAHPGFSLVIEPSRGDATLSYTNGVLTQVTYADASTKDFVYDNGVLTNVNDSSGDDLEFVFSGGVLTEIKVT